MKPHLLILCLACSALLGSPGIARSNGIKIRTGNTRVSAGTGDGVNIDTRRIQLSVPERPSPYYRSPYRIERRRWDVPNTRSYCYGSSTTQSTHQTTQTTGNGAQVYSSTSTQVCE